MRNMFLCSCIKVESSEVRYRTLLDMLSGKTMCMQSTGNAAASPNCGIRSHILEAALHLCEHFLVPKTATLYEESHCNAP
jgi:hypothetical protein